jgi:DNA polymerase-3 subunit alpha
MTIIVFDTETSGLLMPEAAGVEQMPYLLELSAIKLDMKLNEIDKLHMRFKPPIKIPPEATKIHGITDSMVSGCSPFIQSLGKINHFFIGSKFLVGQNLMFDKSVLYWELVRVGKHMSFPFAPGAVCTIEVSLQQFGERYNLQDLYFYMFMENFVGAHSADVDCEITRRCFVEMVKRNWIGEISYE